MTAYLSTSDSEHESKHRLKVTGLDAPVYVATYPRTVLVTKYLKALVAGTSVAIATAIPLAADGIDLQEALIIAGAWLAGAFPTWLVPNTPTRR